MTVCIGLTGGLAAGKDAAAKAFSALGATTLDADTVSRALTADGGAALPLLRQTLGDWAFAEDGALLRDTVRARVFADPALRQKLEQALHPLIQEEMRRQIAAGGDCPYLLLVVPLLLETRMFVSDCRRIAVVDCLPERQIARAVQRDGITPAQAEAIIAAQLPRAQRLARADDIINNDGDFSALQAAVFACHQRYLQLKGTPHDC